MPTKKELERMIADGEYDDDSDDDENAENEVGTPDGAYFRGPRRHARQWAKAHGLKFDPEPDAKPDAKPEGGTVRSARFGGGGAAGQRRSS